MHDAVCDVVQCQQMQLSHLALVNAMRQANAKEAALKEQQMEAIMEEARQKQEEAQEREQELVSIRAHGSPASVFECLTRHIRAEEKFHKQSRCVRVFSARAAHALLHVAPVRVKVMVAATCRWRILRICASGAKKPWQITSSWRHD